MGTIYADNGLEVVLAALRQAGEGWSLQVWGEAHEPEYRRRIEESARGLPVRFRGAFTSEQLASVEADYAVLPSRRRRRPPARRSPHR